KIWQINSKLLKLVIYLYQFIIRRKDENMKKALIKAFPYTIPILLGYLFLGMAFGLLASDIGISPLKAMLISAVIYAGSLQYALLPIFVNPISLISLAVFTVSINIRYIFYGLSLI